MLLIIVIMSSIVFIWVVPTFQSSQVGGNSGAQYSEKFSTLWGNFATFAPSIPEPVTTCNNIPASGLCPPSNPTVCNGITITVATSSNIVVPVNGVCVIEANVGNVFASTGANLTVIGWTINGGLVANYSASVTLTNVQITGFTALLNNQNDKILGTSFDTSRYTGWQADGSDMAVYEGGRGIFSMVNSTVYGQFESEVNHQTVITGSTVTGRLEVESADIGQVTGNTAGMMDFDQNGILLISGNTVYGNDTNYPGSSVCSGGTATAICYGCGNGHPCGSCDGTGYCYGNRWCTAANNVIISGSHNEATCIGNIEIDITNTGSIPVNLVAAYMSNIPVSSVSWKLLSGGPVHTYSNGIPAGQPIVIPVGQGANVTMQWNPPKTLTTLPWTDIYFIFVSSHNNFVDGHIYFGYNPALTVTSQSRPENQVCPPCY